MAEVTDVDITAGVPTAGTGTVKTINELVPVAHDGVDSGRPLKIGGYAKATAPAAVADGDRVNGWFLLNGEQVVTLAVSGVVVKTTKASVNFNRPANVTAYTANDAVNDNATAGGGSSTELTWTIAAAAGIVRRVRVKKTDQTVATPTIRVWFYDTVFASGAGDNEAFVHPATDAIGFVDVAVTNAGSDDAVGWSNCDIPFTAATLYGQLQTLSAFTPASGETFTVDIWYLPG